MILIRLLCPLLLLMIATAGQAQTPPPFKFTERPGPYTVGLKVVEQYDHSRTYGPTTDASGKPKAGNRSRPLQTLIWYPAQPTDAARITYRDYVDLWRTQTSFGHPVETYEMRTIVPYLGDNLSTPMWSVRDATPATGRFPLVIYAPGAWHPGWENADLCEYLASQGYVVISSPSQGVSERKVALDIPNAAAVGRDVSFLIGYGQTLSNVDATSVGVVGHSWGGMAGLYAASRDSRINALVALDGSFRYYAGLLEPAGIRPEQLQLPLLYFMQRNFQAEYFDYFPVATQTTKKALTRWGTSDLLLVHMLGLVHENLNSLSQRQSDTWDVMAKSPLYAGDYDRTDAMVSYGWMSRYTLRFLDYYLKRDASALDFLKNPPSANQVPPHILTAQYSPASAVPLTYEAFRKEVGRLGFARAGEVLTSFRERDASFAVDEPSMLDWSQDLINAGRLSDAVAVQKIDVAMHPQSVDALLFLAHTQTRAENRPGAASAYRAVLDLDPANAEALAGLKAIGSPVVPAIHKEKREKRR